MSAALPHRILAAVLGAGLVACAAPATQRALVPVPVHVVALPGASATATALTRYHHLRVEVQTAEALLQERARASETGDLPSSEAARARAVAALRRAQDDYRQLRLHEALAALSEPLAELTRVATRAEDLELLRDLWFRRALCELALSRRQAAHEALAAAIHLGLPQAPTGSYSPEVEEAIAETRRRIATGAPRGLMLTTRPPRARVFVDGKPMRAAPATLALAPGPHLLRVEKEGFRSAARWWSAPESGTEPQTVALALDPLPLPEVAAALLAGLRAGPPAAAALDPLLLARVAGRERALLAVDPEAARLRSTLIWTGLRVEDAARRECRGADPAALAACLGPALYTLATDGQAAPGDPARPAAVARPFYRRWWFWTIVGVVGGGAVVVIGAHANRGVNVDLRAPR